MDKGWPSVWKSCKLRVPHKSRRDETPSLVLDATKMSLKYPIKSRYKFKERQSAQKSILQNDFIPSSKDTTSMQNFNHFDSGKKIATNTVDNIWNSLNFSNILTVAAVSNCDKREIYDRTTVKHKQKYFIGDQAQRGISDESKPRGNIGPRKIYLGGGFYTAIAIYDKNANVEVVKIGETRLGFMDCVVNKKRRISAQNMRTPLPKLHITNSIDGSSYMPNELKCGKICEEAAGRQRSAKAAPTCRVCEQNKTKANCTVGPKQIKLFLSIDV